MRGKTRPVIVTICGDPGGANAVAPVVEELNKNHEFSTRTFAYRQAIQIFKDRLIPHIGISDDISSSAIQELLAESGASLLVTGTSFNPAALEKKFIRAARNLNIRSLSILDFWSNYHPRFSDEAGELSIVPDKIAVMDEIARRDMIKEGFSPDNLVVTGQPAFDSLIGCKERFSKQTRDKIRKDLNIKNDDCLIMFASQPLSALFGTDEKNPLFPGYTEISVLEALINSLEQIQKNTTKKIVLLIRPHPREAPEAYQKFSSGSIHILISAAGDPRDISLASDLVTGMTSMLLVDAAYLGCTVISIQPGRRTPDPLPTNRSGLSVSVYSEEAIIGALRNVLNQHRHTGTAKKINGNLPDGRSVTRVIDLLRSMISNAE